MTSQELRSVVEKAVEAIERIGKAETAKLEAKEKIAKSCLLTVDSVWAYIAAINTADAYMTLELLITNRTGRGPEVEWKYYDEKVKHIAAPDLKSLLAKVNAEKFALATAPQTLDDALAALDCPPLPALTEALAGPF